MGWRWIRDGSEMGWRWDEMGFDYKLVLWGGHQQLCMASLASSTTAVESCTAAPVCCQATAAVKVDSDEPQT